MILEGKNCNRPGKQPAYLPRIHHLVRNALSNKALENSFHNIRLRAAVFTRSFFHHAKL